MSQASREWRRWTMMAVLLAVCGMLGAQTDAVRAQAGKGEKLLFTRIKFSEKVSSLYSMNPDGSGLTKLSKGDAMEMDPALSPDGKQIAFTVLDPADMRADVYVMNLDGSGRRHLTSQGAKTLAISPNWSPDGKRIAYSTMKMDDFGPPTQLAVFVMDPEGKNTKKLGEGLLPVWSPDGKQLLYTAVEKGKGRDDFHFRLSVMEADGKNAKVLVKGDSFPGDWSPDGKRIVYLGTANDRGIAPDLYTINADGTGQVQLTKTKEEVELAPRWSADGKRIFFNRAGTVDLPKQAPIYVMDADGKNIQQVTKDDSVDLLRGAPLFMITAVREGPAPGAKEPAPKP